MEKLEKLKNIFLNNEIIIFLSFMFLMKPSAITTFKITLINTIYNFFTILVMLIVYSLFIYDVYHKKVSKLQIAILIFICCLGFSTLIGTKDFYFYLKTYCNYFAVSILTEMLILNNPKKLLKVLTILISSFIVINYLTILFIPKGFNYPTYTNYYFLGYDNSTVHFIILGLYVLIFASHYFNKKVSLLVWLMVLVAGLSYFKLWAASCMLCLLIVIFFLLFVYKKNLFKKILNYKVLIGIFAFLFLLIVLIRVISLDFLRLWFSWARS